MENINRSAELPTGSLLAQERVRLGLSQSAVARAVQVHSSSLRFIELQNRVLPPGWYPELRALGMQLREPVWPAQMSSYTGADLHLDLQTCPGLQSRGGLSKQLCVSESVVAEVLRSKMPVPPSWLLKLAELGANVPAQVRMALRPPDSTSQHQGMFAVREWGPGSVVSLPGQLASGGNQTSRSRWEMRMPGIAADAGGLSTGHGQRAAFDPPSTFSIYRQPTDGLSEPGSQPAASVASLPVGTGRDDPAARARPSLPKAAVAEVAPSSSVSLSPSPELYFHWNREGDFQFRASALLLKQCPDGFKALLLQLHQCCLLDIARGSDTPAAES